MHLHSLQLLHVSIELGGCSPRWRRCQKGQRNIQINLYVLLGHRHCNLLGNLLVLGTNREILWQRHRRRRICHFWTLSIHRCLFSTILCANDVDGTDQWGRNPKRNTASSNLVLPLHLYPKCILFIICSSYWYAGHFLRISDRPSCSGYILFQNLLQHRLGSPSWRNQITKSKNRNPARISHDKSTKVRLRRGEEGPSRNRRRHDSYRLWPVPILHQQREKKPSIFLASGWRKWRYSARPKYCVTLKTICKFRELLSK